ncbi:MAG TPA: hypothetical protein VMB71_14550 [Acetobacteraceae bacterium]|nr:hypothetical protein [Acetobacteraceae bacterium]
MSARVRVSPADPAFADAVLADVLRIRRTEVGRALFAALRGSRRVVTVRKPTPAPDPPNAWTQPSPANAQEILLAYNPFDWPCPAHPDSPPSDAMLFARLGDAVAIAEAPGAPGEAPSLGDYMRQRAELPPSPTLPTR